MEGKAGKLPDVPHTGHTASPPFMPLPKPSQRCLQDSPARPDKASQERSRQRTVSRIMQIRCKLAPPSRVFGLLHGRRLWGAVVGWRVGRGPEASRKWVRAWAWPGEFWARGLCDWVR